MAPVPSDVLLVAPGAIVMAPVVAVTEVLPAPPGVRFAFCWTWPPEVIVMAPVPVLVVPAITRTPVVEVRLIGPAPVAVAVTLAPSLSARNTPPDPALAVTVPAVV